MEGKKEPIETSAEYTFESGVEEIMKRVEALLTQQDYVVIEVNGSDASVGKTRLEGNIMGKLKLRIVPCVSVADSSLFANHHLRDLRRDQQFLGSRKGVIFFGAALDRMEYELQEDRQKIRNSSDRSIRNMGQEFGLDVSKVDIIVAIYSPKKPFFVTPVGDIIIRNEHAKDK